VQAFIDSLAGVPWFENVGKPYEKPSWAKKLEQVDSWAATSIEVWNTAKDAVWDATSIEVWDATETAAWFAARFAAWDAARDTAKDAAWDATWSAARTAIEITRGIKDGYFSKLMEVYRAGHYPCSLDGETLVVY